MKKLGYLILIKLQNLLTKLSIILNNHFRLAFLFAVIGIGLFELFTAQYQNEKISAKILNVSLFLAFITVFEKFFNRFNFNVADKISEDSKALALYLGFIAIAIGICVAIG